MGTVAARSICVEHLPCPSQCLGSKAGAGIGHTQNKAVVFPYNGQGDGSAARGVGGSVVQVVFRTRQQGIRRLVQQYHPDDVAFEELFFARNVTTALTVGAARGAAIIAAAEYTENLYEYTPMQIKQALTGWGKADKKQIQQMVKFLLHLEAIPRPDDAADGIAAAITHIQAGAAKSQFRMK